MKNLSEIDKNIVLCGGYFNEDPNECRVGYESVSIIEQRLNDDYYYGIIGEALIHILKPEIEKSEEDRHYHLYTVEPFIPNLKLYESDLEHIFTRMNSFRMGKNDYLSRLLQKAFNVSTKEICDRLNNAISSEPYYNISFSRNCEEVILDKRYKRKREINSEFADIWAMKIYEEMKKSQEIGDDETSEVKSRYCMAYVDGLSAAISYFNSLEEGRFTDDYERFRQQLKEK